MRLVMIINWFITVALIFLGAFIGESIDYPWRFAFIATLIIFAIIIQFLLNGLQSTNNELTQEKAKLSALLIKKGNQSDILQCAFYLKNYGARLRKAHRYNLDILINSHVPLLNNLELKLFSDKEINVYVNNQTISSRVFAKKYEYILGSCLMESLENKHFRFSIDVEFITDGTQLLMIEADNQ